MTEENQKTNKYEALLDTKHLQSELKKRAIKGAGFIVSSQTISVGIQTIGTFILARLLSPGDFGIVAMVSTFSLIIQSFGINGFTEAVIQFQDISHDQLSKLFWVNFFIMFLFTSAFMALSPALAWFYKEPQLKKITMAMSLSILFGGLTTCHFALLSRNMKFHLTSLMNVLAGILSTGIAVIAATQRTGYWALVLRRVSFPLLTAFFAWLFCRWRPAIPAKNTNISAILKYGFQTYGNYLMDYFRRNSDKIIIGKLFGKSPLGHYDRAINLSALLPNQLTSSLTGVGVATLSRLKDDPKRYLDYYTKSISIFAFLAFPGSTLFTLVGKDIIIVLLGAQWSQAGDLLTALAPAIGLVVIYDTNIWLHLSLGRPDRLLKWGIFTLIAAIFAFFVGSIFGPMGVAVAYSTLFFIFLLPALYYAGKPMNIKASYYLSILWKYWSAAVLAGGFYLMFLKGFKAISLFYFHLAPLLRITFGSLLYTLVYMGFILVLFRGPKPLFLLISISKDIFRR